MIERHLIEIKNARIFWKNFTGVERRVMVKGRMQVVNGEGKRNFNVVIDPENSEFYFDKQRITDPNFGQIMAEMGYRVVVMPGKEEGEPSKYRLQVEVRYPEDRKDSSDGNTKFVPKLSIINDDGSKTPLFYNTVHELDECDVERCNIEINNSTGHDQNTGEEYAKCWCNKGNFWLAHSIIDEY